MDRMYSNGVIKDGIYRLISKNNYKKEEELEKNMLLVC